MGAIRERIIELHQRDSAAARKARVHSEIPASYECITTQWLTSVLCQGNPGAEVIDFQLGPRDDGTANRRRIHLTFNQAGTDAGLPGSVFCKATHDLLHRLTLGITGGVHAEVTFYRQVRPLLDLNIPEAIFAAYDPNSFNSLIVMKDLGSDVLFCGAEPASDRARVTAQLELLAGLHARFYERAELRQLDLISWPRFFRNVVSHGQEAATNRGFLAAEAVIPPRLLGRYDDIWKATVASVEDHERRPRTVLHGDCHLKQWFVGPEGRVGLTDWQCCTVGNWARDVAYMMAASLAVEDRRRWERDLLAHYLDVMRSLGAAVPGFDEAWELYRCNLLSALNWWTGTLTPAPEMPPMQPPADTLIFIERLAHAVDDLDAVDACLAL